MLDGDGWPHQRTLSFISRWPGSNESLLQYVSPYFSKLGRAITRGDRITLETKHRAETGEVIIALKKNTEFWYHSWVSSNCDGVHVFET